MTIKLNQILRIKVREETMKMFDDVLNALPEITYYNILKYRKENPQKLPIGNLSLLQLLEYYVDNNKLTIKEEIRNGRRVVLYNKVRIRRIRHAA